MPNKRLSKTREAYDEGDFKKPKGNKSYIKGRSFEYKRKKVWENQNAIVFRTAGSHGLYDLIAIQNGWTYLIQCKVVDSEGKAKALIEKWKFDPPIPEQAGQKFFQVLEVHVNGSSETLTVTV